jgi:hypothetical protein
MYFGLMKATHEFLAACLKEDPEDRMSAVELSRTKFVREASTDKRQILDLLARHRAYNESQQKRYLRADLGNTQLT